MKILVIDDSPEDRELVITYIKKGVNGNKIIIDESNCLSNALEKITASNYDVILLDLALPETDGLETIKTIKGHMKKVGRNIPIVILTGMEDYNMGVEAFSLGIKDYLIKDEIHTKEISRALTCATFNNKAIII